MRRLPKVVVVGLAAMALALTAAPRVSYVTAFAHAATPTASASLSEATLTAVQQALNRQGIAVSVDGKLNDETRAAIRAFQTQHHLPATGEPDQATLDKLGVGEPRSGVAGQRSPGQAMGGPGMNRRETGGMMGPHMMGRDMRAPDMMRMMPGQQGTTDPMRSPYGMSAGGGPGHRMVVVPARHLSVEDVRHFFEHWLADAGNQRLKVGEVREVDDNRIAADIVTQEGALVDRFEVDRHMGAMERVE